LSWLRQYVAQVITVA